MAVRDIPTYLAATAVLMSHMRTKRPSHIGTIAVVQSMKMGDMVCTTPLLHALRTHHPDAHLMVIGDAVNRELLAGHPDVDEYLVFSKGLVGLLRKRHIDVGILPGPNPDGLALLALAGASMIITPAVQGGWSPYETRPYTFMRKFVTVCPHHMDGYAPREYLRLLEPLGIFETDTTKRLAVSEEAQSHAHTLLPEGLLVGIAPSAGNKVKQWPVDRFARIADYVAQTHQATVVVLGSSKDATEAQELLQLVRPETRVLDLCGKLSVEELKAVVAKLDLLVASDTGPIYLAEAFGVATVDIVGPVDEHVQPPRGARHRVVLPPGERVPQISIMNSRVYDAAEVKRQSASTRVEDVCSAIDELLS